MVKRPEAETFQRDQPAGLPATSGIPCTEPTMAMLVCGVPSTEQTWGAAVLLRMLSVREAWSLSFLTF